MREELTELGQGEKRLDTKRVRISNEEFKKRRVRNAE
jgi:hypothetical protein